MNLCKHSCTHFENWPDGGDIEVCDNCGYSRYLWEQGASDWVIIQDLDLLRQRLQKMLDSIKQIWGNDEQK